MQDQEIDDEQNGLPSQESGRGRPGWSDLSRRVIRLSGLVRMQVSAHGVPALATLLMQGIVL